MLSFWEHKHLLEYDLVVVGAGIVGLSTAIQFKRKNPQAKVLVLERGIFPSGASTKNAGFACFGSLTEILDDLSSMSPAEVFGLVEKRFLGLQAIRREFGDDALSYLPSGGFELFTEREMSALEKIPEVNRLLHPLFGEDVFERLDSIQDFGFADSVLSVVKNKFEGELDTGKFFLALWEKSLSLDIKVITGAKVLELDVVRTQVSVSDPVGSKPIVFSGNRIAVCTNAFARQLVPDLDIKPGRGMVLTTKPLLRTIPWRGSFHYDKGYVYFRHLDGRLLIGGGRNLDFTGEETIAMGINPKLKVYLLGLISEVVLPGQPVEIDMEWSGIMAFGASKIPIVKLIQPKIGIAVRLGGMGVAIGWQTAGELVALFDQK